MPTPTELPRLPRAVQFAALLVLLTVSQARAQVWSETGDAGSTVPTAQGTIGNGPLTGIQGNLASPTDVDLYCIKLSSVPPAGAPLVQFQCVVNQGPNVWLFDATGKGVLTNSTCSGGNKTIVAPNVSLLPGNYYVGVSYTGVDPQSSSGAIWNTSVSGQHAPDGPGAAGTLTTWAGTPNVQPVNPYSMTLSFMAYCDSPVPTSSGTWGRVRIRYGR